MVLLPLFKLSLGTSSLLLPLPYSESKCVRPNTCGLAATKFRGLTFLSSVMIKPMYKCIPNCERRRRKNVMIRIEQDLVAKAHNYGLNISKVSENALIEVIEALESRRVQPQVAGGPGRTRTGDPLRVREIS